MKTSKNKGLRNRKTGLQGLLSLALPLPLPLTMSLGILMFPAHASEEVHGANHLSVFTGNTDFSEHGSGLTLGIDYEYRVSPLLGLGSVIEYAYGSLDALTVLAVADIHVTEQFIVQVGPGFEHSSEHDFAVTRLGALYEYRYHGYTVSPQLHVDYHFGHSSSVVAGLALGFDF